MTEPRAWPHITAFCLFAGYGRSGHSAIGSLIDSHPQAVVSHELNAVKRYFEGVTRDALFDEIYDRSQNQARAGRESPRAEGGAYSHHLPGQLKSSPETIRVIGDKKGAGTTRQFALHGLGRLDAFKTYVGVPVRILHVVRNPFDMIAAGMAAGRSNFPRLVATAAALRQQCRGEDWLDLRHEDIIAAPEREMRRILAFLGLTVTGSYLEQCRRHLFKTPHRRRFEVTWGAAARAQVEALIARYDFLQGYTFEE